MPKPRKISGGCLYTPTGRRKYLSPSERARFIAAAWACPRSDLGTFCLVLAYTGCRISECLALTAQSFDVTECFVAVRSLKKRSHAVVIREIPLPDDVMAEIVRVHGLATGEQARKLWTWCRCRAWQLVKAIMTEAHIEAGIHATPKGLRHGFGLQAIRSGVPLNFVQRWLGHARMETTSIYLQAIGPEEREIAGRMWTLAVAAPH
ncbi:site-specific integrase [Bradyrhizobium sp. LMTR 3]|uniref:tyrosine-type recombinase/integrase n=1 Tax=Bradyrhizobium sp. LMTR 3 TaxID=189873 RepID=UPI000810892A|nr:site-specific integrase [Bradyrhizobium sp. LMTR 3]OCK55410.1 integrase [Bradyrhizobium sp. LMTR 3]